MWEEIHWSQRRNEELGKEIKVLREEEREEASRKAIMERMTQPEIPTEVLRNIIGFTLRSTVRFCGISTDKHERDTWKEYADREKALVWPANLSSNAKQTIRQAVAATFLESAVLVMPAEFVDGTCHLAIPRAIRGSENRLRNLVLNLDMSSPVSLVLWGRIKPRLQDLGPATAVIETMAQKFPRLETSVLVIDMGKFVVLGNEDATGSCPFPDIVAGKLAMLRSALLDLIDGFAKHGPGKRRLLRFECHLIENR
jgi:hypothetical protein